MCGGGGREQPAPDVRTAAAARRPGAQTHGSLLWLSYEGASPCPSVPGRQRGPQGFRFTPAGLNLGIFYDRFRFGSIHIPLAKASALSVWFDFTTVHERLLDKV